MTNRVVIKQGLWHIVRDLSRRVRSLETRPRVASGEGEEVTQTYIDTNEAARVVVGLQADGKYGIRVLNASGTVVFDHTA